MVDQRESDVFLPFDKLIVFLAGEENGAHVEDFLHI